MNIVFKKTIATVSVVGISLSLYAQQFTITGKMAVSVNGTVVLAYVTDRNQTTYDTAVVKNGMFSFKGTIAEPTYSRVMLNPATASAGRAVPVASAQLELFIDPSQITISGDSSLTGATVKGGPSNQDFQSIMKELKLLGDRGDELSAMEVKYRAEGNDAGITEVRAEVASLREKRKAVQQAFIEQHPESFVAFNLWTRKTAGLIKIPAMETEFNRFSDAIRNSPTGKQIAGRIAVAKKLAVGKPAIDFTLPDTQEQQVTLSSFKGKNVVLCFWYRNFVQFPEFAYKMLQISKQLKNDNVALVAVYYNNTGTKDDWRNVIDENNMQHWTNLIDFNGLSTHSGAVSTTAKTYDLNFAYLPQCYVLDKNGIILSRDINMAENPVTQIKSLLGIKN
jgi:peroxiredoxin